MKKHFRSRKSYYSRLIYGEEKAYTSGSWFRRYTYMTKLGIVIIDKSYTTLTNRTVSSTTFITVISGIEYEMEVNTTLITEAGLKRMATQFLKSIIKETSK